MPSSSPAKTRRVNLSRVPEVARPAILAQIARGAGIKVEEIIVEGV